MILEKVPSVHISACTRVDMLTQYCPLYVDLSPVPDSVTFKNILYLLLKNNILIVLFLFYITIFKLLMSWLLNCFSSVVVKSLWILSLI